MSEKFYITTPIYYPSGKWHLGHCYTTVSCDVLARFNRLDGKDVFFLTGTDEHGVKIEKRATEAKMSPYEFVTPLVDELKSIFKIMNISNDKFIRTTDKEHTLAVQKIFKKLYEKNAIYKSSYEGWYCTPCESFWTDTQLVDGKCPDCGREVSKEKEESYFFKLSDYSDRILKLYEENPEFIQPKSRQNEMINNFIKPGLTDLCVSRTSVKWGIPVDFDLGHTVYVWVDALSNYITALGYLSDDDSLFKRYWPADLQMMGKEIVRFHTIIWPAMLMALDLPLPKREFGHGWLLIGGDKLSKSKTDKIRTEIVDPFILTERYGVDAIRYFLLREVPFGSDGVYTNASLLNRINSDLVNDLGNLVSRTVAMVEKYFDGIVVSPSEILDIDNDLIATASALYPKVKNSLNSLLIPQALTDIFSLVSRSNKYIDETAPWILAKSEDGIKRLSRVLYNLIESIRIVAGMLSPFLPETSEKVLKALSLNGKVDNFDDFKEFGKYPVGTKVVKGESLFKRIDTVAELDLLDELAAEIKLKNAPKEIKQKEMEVDIKPEITIDDFAKIDLKTAKVIACTKVEKADKLLNLTLDVGGETRTVLSGIAKFYTAEEMVGKTVVLIANLAKAKIRGIESCGMILCSEDSEGNLSLVSPEKIVNSGATVR